VKIVFELNEEINFLIPYLLVAIPRFLNLETFSNCYMRYVRMEVFRGLCIWILVNWAVILCCSLVDGQQCCGRHADFIFMVKMTFIPLPPILVSYHVHIYMYVYWSCVLLCMQVPPPLQAPDVDLLTAGGVVPPPGSIVPDIQTEIVVQSSPPSMTM
jgi:hypothetical protein